MIEYEVSVAVRENRVDAWCKWMQDTHIPDVLATGYFTAADFLEVLEGDIPADHRGYRIRYFCPSLEDLRSYQARAAPALQRDHSERFAGGFSAYRSLVRSLRRYSHPAVDETECGA